LADGLTFRAACLAAFACLAFPPNAAAGDGLNRGEARSSSPDAGTAPEYVVAGQVLRLVVRKDGCAIEHVKSARAGPGASPGRALDLDLRPPCHVLTWRQRPPATAAEREGTPVGGPGDAAGWRYPGKGVVVAVIGDPPPKRLRAGATYRLRRDQGLHCASSIRGVLVGEGEIQLSKKREHVGIFCAETGLDEKDYWLLAHP